MRYFAARRRLTHAECGDRRAGLVGATLVESVQGRSDEIRFVAGATRTVRPRSKTFADAQGLGSLTSFEALLDDPEVDAVVLATPHSLHTAAGRSPPPSRQARLLREAVRPDKADAEAAVAGDAEAGVTLGLGYNRRFHPEMIKLRERMRSGEPRHDPARRGDDDVPQRAVPHVRRSGARTARRRPAAA